MTNKYTIKYCLTRTSGLLVYAYNGIGEKAFLINAPGVLPYLFDTREEARDAMPDGLCCIRMVINPKHENDPYINQ